MPSVALAKVSMNYVTEAGGPLSGFEDEYNSRILTILEGPLAGQSFRILKYIGYVHPVNSNGGLPSIAGTPVPDPNSNLTPWSTPVYADANAEYISYSVLIDLMEVKGEQFTGQYFPAGSAKKKSTTLSLLKWISTFGIESLFYHPRQTTSSPWEGYRFVINDAVFNSVGIGVEEVSAMPSGSGPVPVVGYGNIDSKRLMRIPTNRPKVSPALLPDYDYLTNPTIMAANPNDGGKVGVDAIGLPRTNPLQFRLSGHSNEGYDVPDYRDMFLSHGSYTDHDNDPTTPPVFYVIPSYHRPEVVQHLAHVFGDPASMTFADVRELLQMIDMSSARVMSYLGVNEGFRQSDANVPRLPSSGFTWSNPPTAAEIFALRTYVLKHVQGPWDVDNDGDGIADSVWIDPGLPIVYSPDGRRLKPLAAILIEDLDGRVNLNAAGDRIQGLLQPDPNNPTIATSVPTVNMSTNANYKRSSTLIPNGFGYGPADISLPIFFGQSGGVNHTVPTVPQFPAFRSSTTRFSFFDELYGARRSPEWRHRPINYLSPMLDRTAGTRNTNDPISQIGEREYHPDPSSRAQHSRLPALPVGRRAGQAMSFDLNGNPAMVITAGIDADSTVPTVGVVPSEVMDDRYESHVTGRANSDDPLGLTELEAVLRRFDADAASLPPRIRELISSTGFSINDYISREITTRSGELRNANIAAVAKTADPALGVTVQHQTPSYLRYIQWLHSQRQRTRTFPTASASDDPELSYAAIAELFPMDFSKGLRMDLNRPFGDGFDNDNDGQVDEPSELSATLQQELYPGSGATIGAYNREVKLQAFHDTGSGNVPLASETRGRLASRLILARNLYCLAQLVVPREHDFPGMSGVTNFWDRAKLRARALAQWAVNVVDFRDADATMTRFEYDIVPFGIGRTNAVSNSSIAARPAFWAPDRISYSLQDPSDNSRQIPNKIYVGVVWGMEMPEALLSETFAIHDKRVRNTDMDSSGLLTVKDDPNSDPHFDQYRFPEASLFVEITNPRTTSIASDPSVPGAPSSLYTTNGANVVLDLARLAPTAGTWGRQPVWRVAISQDYDVASIPIDNRPGSILSKGPEKPGVVNPNYVHLPFTTFQHSIENVGTTSDSAITGITNLNSPEVTNIERYIGNGLVYNYRDPAQTSPESGGFERFIWFTDVEPGTSQPIPDIMPSLRSLSGGQHASVYTARTGNALLKGGGYLVVGPRSTTNIGSLMHNQFTGLSYMQDVGLPPNSNLERIKITAANRNIWSPGYQRIELLNNSVRTHLLNSDSANERLANALLLKRGSPEVDYVKNAQFLICAVDAPVATGIPTGTSGTNWDLSFPGGIGLNVSLPTPISDEVNPSAVWYKDHRPVTRLNSTDTVMNRADGTPGWGSPSTPPDSWVNLGATPPTGTFPNQPFDHTNPLIGPLNRYKTGTYEHVRTAYLQRLADPDFGYDPVSNPYITVDWMPIDLTVFNGEAPLGAEVITNGPAGNIMDPRFNDNIPNPNLAFQSRYKNGSLAKTNVTDAAMAPNRGISYHSPETPDLRFSTTVQPSPPPPGSGNIKYDAYFGRVIGFDQAVDWSKQQASGTTLGYANVGFHTGGSLVDLASATPNPFLDTNFDGFGVPLSNAVEPFRGTTNRIQNLLWYNRPFASPYEVALVPGTSPGQFGLYHSAYSGTEKLPFTYMPSFQAMNAWATNNVTPTEHERSYWSVYEPITASSQHMADWHLLLDMVETQPPFADANRFMPPDAVLALSTSDNIAARYLNSYIPKNYSGVLSEPETVRGATLLAPFNKQPNFVAAGKVNLNTISFDRFGRSRALEAVDYSFSRGVSVTVPFKIARHGYDVTNLPVNSFFGFIVANMHPEFPTQFVGAYRPAMTSNIAPSLRTPAATEQMRRGYGVETSLLRSADWNAANEANASPATLPTSPMLFNTAGTDDVSRMQQFDRMQRAMRLPNLVTNQSNVFAVWVTVSLFEYDPLTEFGNEYKNQNGQPIRERQFFIIDRSVPVGYRPGENLNSERTVLLQKRL
jgi:hypothetical protein